MKRISSNLSRKCLGAIPFVDFASFSLLWCLWGGYNQFIPWSQGGDDWATEPPISPFYYNLNHLSPSHVVQCNWTCFLRYFDHDKLSIFFKRKIQRKRKMKKPWCPTKKIKYLKSYEHVIGIGTNYLERAIFVYIY